jgi:hypothetical protein
LEREERSRWLSSKWGDVWEVVVAREVERKMLSIVMCRGSIYVPLSYKNTVIHVFKNVIQSGRRSSRFAEM